MPEQGFFMGGGKVLPRSGIARDVFVLTRAEVNAGKILVYGDPSVKLEVVRFRLKGLGIGFSGSSGGTAIQLESTAATPVAIATALKANLTNAFNLPDTEANAGATAALRTPLGRGAGLRVIKTGTAFDAGDYVQVELEYQIADGPKIAAEGRGTTSTTTSTTTTSTSTTTTTT